MHNLKQNHNFGQEISMIACLSSKCKLQGVYMFIYTIIAPFEHVLHPLNHHKHCNIKEDLKSISLLNQDNKNVIKFI